MPAKFKIKYLLILFILLLGYFVLYFYSGSIDGHTICIFKKVTDIPCPACGSIRSTVQLIHGDFLEAIFINPLGVLTNILVVVSIGWMIRDVAKNRETFFPFLKKDWDSRVKFGAAMVVAVNWVWNILKGL